MFSKTNRSECRNAPDEKLSEGMELPAGIDRKIRRLGDQRCNAIYSAKSFIFLLLVLLVVLVGVAAYLVLSLTR